MKLIHKLMTLNKHKYLLVTEYATYRLTPLELPAKVKKHYKEFVEILVIE